MGGAGKGTRMHEHMLKTHEDLGVLIDPESGVQPFHSLIEGD